MEECLGQVTDTSNRNIIKEGHFNIMTFARTTRTDVSCWGETSLQGVKYK